MKKDQVGRLIERRPMSEDLAQQGILRAGVNVAARIQGVQQTLARNLAKSNLYHGLKHRPTVQELKSRGVYVEREDEQNVPLYSHEYSPDYYSRDSYGHSQQGYDIAHDEEEQYYDNENAPRLSRPHDDEKQYYDNTHSENVPLVPEANYQRRSKSFHLTRILLKYVNSWGETGDLSIAQKGVLKDLIVDQDQVILAVAEAFDAENDLNDFKDSLLRLTTRAQ